MQIRLITPAPPRSRAGNRATAARWTNILRHLGHTVRVSVDYRGEAADMMIALHAWRSAAAVVRFTESYPGRPVIVALTGTDAYRFIHSHPEATLRSIDLADRLVGLHDLIGETIPERYRDKLRVIYQSARPTAARRPVKRYFRVCVAGHLREEKDPLRPAWAVRDLPRASRLQVVHYGKAITPEWADRAEREMKENSRYRWFGEVPHAEVRRAYTRAHLLALPSRMEGGANVISEAVVAGLPVVASRIAGSVGLLGSDYPGYFAPQDTGALSALLVRAETDAGFYRELEDACGARRPRFTVDRERDQWAGLLADL